ncbi:MAG: Holliday junction resolvase RuvX [Gammaproteobacteria bacterium]|nr:Holliday junction resolvase RuvX [Gammaproteobacteria bacterium]
MIIKNNNLNQTHVYLGIDFGIKKIGFAIGQLITKQASPLSIIINKNNKIDWKEIDKIIKTWDIRVIILGYPYSNKINKLNKNLEIFYSQLKVKYASKIKIIKFSEILSTESSKETYKELRKDKIRKKKAKLDDISASIILQSWFNENMIN